MITLKDLSQLENLPIPSSLKTYLQDQLISQPFDNLVDAKQFWQESFTQLILLESSDQLQSLKNILPNHYHQLTHFPEYIQKTPNDHFLALTITDQAGGGCYLLFPDSTQIEELQQLKRIAE
jgi:hypothetical protein